MKHKPILILSIASGIVSFMLSGCATASGARPDDMSAAEHREAARRDEKKAAEEEAKYDPDAARGEQSWNNKIYFPEKIYNPTEKHQFNANEYKEYARQHREAAQKLEEYEVEECAAFPKSTRVKCPLIGNVERVEDIEGGARLYFFGDPPNIKAIAEHMRCHYAFGRKVGREGMPDCPLYLKDLDIEISGDRSVDITSNDAAVVEKIRKRSLHHVSK